MSDIEKLKEISDYIIEALGYVSLSEWRERESILKSTYWDKDIENGGCQLDTHFTSNVNMATGNLWILLDVKGA